MQTSTTFLNKTRKGTIAIKMLRVLAIEVFKTINAINPSYMKNIFILKVNLRIRPNKILVRHHETASSGDKV